MTLLLIRHGETALNVARVLQPAATPLSERGLAQAQALGRRLAGAGVRAILSSDLPRALRTAELIAEHTGAPIETTPLLQERNFGDWRGRPYAGLGPLPLETSEAPPGGESMRAFEDRVAAAFAWVLTRRAASGGTLAVVTHGLVLRVVLERHARFEPGTGLPDHLGNTGLSIIEARAPHRVRLLNCTQHLEGGVQDDRGSLSGG
ncbi:MAG: histidine phosphatase family protein [Pseudomonadota bacterium]|nr:histidine phosphatase family protein [Pseudomonadota bacterium]